MYDNSSRVIEVDIDEILPNRFQPRIQFDEEEILELSDSIKEHGVIQPIVVRAIGDKYEIIAGERRYKASVLAGRETVPVIVKNLNDKDSAEIALIENVQRKNLSPIEEALSYKKILDMGYITQEDLASKLGKSQPAVANKIRLLNLSDEVQEALLENKISERHARSLLKLPTSKQQNEMLNRIINERLTVRRTDEEINKLDRDTESSQDDGSQKVIESGENNMNNNLNNNFFGMPSMPEAPQAPQPFNVNPQPEVQSVNTQNFDIFGGSSQNVTTETPQFVSAPVQPVQEPAPATPTFSAMGGENLFASPNLDMPPMSTFNTELGSIGQMPMSTPTIDSTFTNTAPIDLDQNFNIPTPVMEPQSSFNIEPTPVNIQTNDLYSTNLIQPQPEVPTTSPIMESPVLETQVSQPTDNVFGFSSEPVNVQPEVQPEYKPEPIIVTDYSKQYDPIMPQAQEVITPKVEFKEVINAIRECSKKIEQYGFKIDVEEYDLANLYQVIFKVEK